MRRARRVRIAMAGIATLMISSLVPAKDVTATPDANSIIQQSVAANQRDWNAEPEYSYSETIKSGKGTKTWQVTMLYGSPYRKLIRENGEPLSAAEQKNEEEKFRKAVAEWRSESAQQAAGRIADYEKDRKRDHRLMEELTRAFEFQLTGKAQMAGRSVYVLRATPRTGYQPTDRETRVLKGMRGTLWIDQQSFQWVRVQAEVVSPVTIEGFLATVEPGTRFELEKMPVADGIWQPKHFSVRSHSKVLLVFHHQRGEDDTWFDYQKTPSEYAKK
jgi:hypothetical protein